MQSGINIEINMFGILSSFSGDEPLILNIPSGSNIKEILDVLKINLVNKFPEFNHHKVLDASVFADEKEILKKDHIITKDTNLAILPPVCGG